MGADKLTNVFIPRPSTRPHKPERMSPPHRFLRNRPEYALTGNEAKICMQQFIKTDGKVQADITYPAGLGDFISLNKTRENFHLSMTPRVTLLFVVVHLRKLSTNRTK